MVSRDTRRDTHKIDLDGKVDPMLHAPAGSPHLREILSPFRPRYRDILKKRAKLSFVGSRRATTTPYQTIVYQEGLDDLRIAIGELESEIASSLYVNLKDLVDDLLDISVRRTLSSSRKKMVPLPSPPDTPKKVRAILYRMYRGGTFYPLVFTREVESEFYKVLGQMVSLQGMRGREVASQTRKHAVRLGLDLREIIFEGLQARDYMVEIGPVRWSWRRGKTVRRLAFSPLELREEAIRVADVLNTAVAKRNMASGRTVIRP
jgi:hypothetical protein